MATGRTRSPARVAFLAWSAALGAAALHAAARGQLGPRRLGALSAAWYAVATVGVLFPRLEMYGPIVSRGPGGRRSRVPPRPRSRPPRAAYRIMISLAMTILWIWLVPS